jgi:hypothetical protein
MVDFASTHARAMTVAPSASHEGGQTEVAVVKPLNASPLSTVNGGGQAVSSTREIHAIIAVQLVECVHWRRVGLTSSLVWARTGEPRTTVAPSTAKMAPTPPTDFSSRAPLWC